jgi:hypothetical protein
LLKTYLIKIDATNIIQRNGEKTLKEGNAESTMAVIANDNKIYEANEMSSHVKIGIFEIF